MNSILITSPRLDPPKIPTPFKKKNNTPILIPQNLSQKNTPMLHPPKKTPHPFLPNKQTKSPQNRAIALDDRNPGRCQSAVEASCTSSLGQAPCFAAVLGAFWRVSDGGGRFPREIYMICVICVFGDVLFGDEDSVSWNLKKTTCKTSCCQFPSTLPKPATVAQKNGTLCFTGTFFVGDEKKSHHHLSKCLVKYTPSWELT